LPSPTLRSWPTSLTCASAPMFWISRFRIALISAGWMSILVTSHGRTDAGQLGAKRRIDHARAQHHNETAEKRGIDFGVEARLTAEPGFERRLQLGEFAVVEGTGGSHFGLNLAAVTREDVLVAGDDLGEREEPALGSERQDELGGEVAGAHLRQHGLHRLRLIGFAESRRADDVVEVLAGLQRRLERRQIILERRKRPGLVSQFENGGRVAPCQTLFAGVFRSHVRPSNLGAFLVGAGLLTT